MDLQFDLAPLVTNMPVRTAMDAASDDDGGSDVMFFPPAPKELESSLLDGDLNDNLMLLSGLPGAQPERFKSFESMFPLFGVGDTAHFPSLMAPVLQDDDGDDGSVNSQVEDTSVGSTPAPPSDPAGETQQAEATSESAEKPEEQRKRERAARTAARRRRHNQIEIARRKELADQFSRLKQVLGEPEKATRGDVLNATIERLRKYGETVTELEQRKQAAKRRKLHVSGTRGTDDKQEAEGDEGEGAKDRTAPKTAFLHSGVAMSVVTIDGQIVDVNPQFEELFKNSKDNLTKLSMFTVTHPDYRPKTYQVHGNLIDPHEVEDAHEMKSRLVNCTGDILSAHVTSWVVSDPDTGKPKYVYSTIVPIEVEPKAGREFLEEDGSGNGARGGGGV